MFEIDFVKYFSDNEKKEVENYVNDNFNDLDLHNGWNYSVDVSDAIGRTANVDVFVKGANND